MTQFVFPTDIEGRGYRVFTPELEDDPNVLFHGTSIDCCKSILTEGFKRGSGLPSVSFAKNSSLALRYACEAQSDGVDGCIIVVRYSDLSIKGISNEISVVHDYRDVVDVEILGVCRIPSDYQHT